MTVYDAALVPHEYDYTVNGDQVDNLPRMAQYSINIPVFDVSSASGLLVRGFNQAINQNLILRPFNCTACGPEAYTGMTLCHWGCR